MIFLGLDKKSDDWYFAYLADDEGGDRKKCMKATVVLESRYFHSEFIDHVTSDLDTLICLYLTAWDEAIYKPKIQHLHTIKLIPQICL